MIRGDPARATVQPAHGAGRLTIDDVFHQVAQRRPDALAIADPPNCESFTDGEPRRLTFAEADRIVTAIAGRLRRMGLPTDAIVGIQMPNVTENILAMLAVLRAGMIVAPLPLLWRRVDAVTALGRIGPKALMTCNRVGAFDHCQFAMQVAADVFCIRYVCGFGKNLPDGVVSFEDLFTAETPDPVEPLDPERRNSAAAHIAAITFDVGEGGLVPVARNHAELFAGGLAVLLESRLAENSSILSALAPSSFAGIAITLLPWLLSGGTLVLHHPFDPDIFARQQQEDRCGTLILPGAVLFGLAESSIFAAHAPKSVIATWRSPDRLAESPVRREPDIAFVDVAIFGEAALVPALRGGDGRPCPLSFGPVVAPRGSAVGAAVAELMRTDADTVAVRGAMVPQYAFPLGIERSGLPYFKIGRDGLVDTGYRCRADPITGSMVLTDPPSGIVNVGGYRFPLGELQDVVGRIDGSATLEARPDPLLGQRLIGNAADRDTLQAALNTAGLSPLVVGAFRAR